MINLFSPQVSQILSFSKDEATRLSCSSVKPEHLVLGIMREKGNVLSSLFAHMNISQKDIKIQLEQRAVSDEDTFSNKDPESISLNGQASHVLKIAVMEARVRHTTVVDVEHVILAILHDQDGNGAKQVLEMNHIDYDTLRQYFQTESTTKDGISLSEDDVLTNMDSDDGSQSGNSARSTQDTMQARTKGKSDTPVLDHFSTDLTLAANEGKLDPIVGRENEIRRVTEILCRRKKNNPILIGEPGVGKSAIAEGLAQLIAQRKTSPILFNRRIVRLDMTAIVAGTKYRGQFEERLQALLKELECNPDIIVFIDEIHTIIGAGGSPGTMDAANIMKPALARGVIQCVGATTLDEYRNSIEKDGALERRFQKVMVEPTSTEETLEILQNIKSRYEDHHHVKYTDEAIEACVRLTGRYVSGRCFPDKAIDALDEVGSKVHLQHAVVPAAITEKEREIGDMKQKKQTAVSNQDFEMAATYRDKQTVLEQELKTLNEEWLASEDRQRETVTATNVANVVSTMAGIPLQRITETESERLKNMAARLKSNVIAQESAIDKITKSIQRNRLGLKEPNHPIGVFMFLGPTGVGKTYLAQCLAEIMFGSKDALIRIDMSEYSEKFNTSRLVGAPPGYVGYGEGGQLTEKVRRHPYSIVLLDEIEKAHGDVFNLLLQVLDEGRMTDGNGRIVDFRNTIIIMTSNAGTRQLSDFGKGVGFNAATDDDNTEQDKQRARSIIQKSLSKQFAPEFLNRLDEIIMFDKLDSKAIRHIVDIELNALFKRITRMGYSITISEEAKDFIATKGFDAQFGARPLKRAIQTYIEDELCDILLSDKIKEGSNIVIAKDASSTKLKFDINTEDK
jgi:ATP-dependent Clp protease ATP-binding subunit ClpC